MKKSFDLGDILMCLENKTANTFSDNELFRRAAEEIRLLREQLEVAERRIQELSLRVIELMKETVR